MEKNDKYLWKEGDLQRVTEEDMKNSDVIYEEEYDILKEVGITDYDDEDIKNSELIAKEIFKRHEAGLTKESAFKLFSSFYSIMKEFVPEGVVYTKELYNCTKLQVVNLMAENKDIAFSKKELKEIFS